MRSKASIKGHPIHPIIVTMPVGFLTGAFLFSVAGRFFNNENFKKTSRYLTVGGIGSAFVAAIPGILDYIYTIPPNSSAKKRGTNHAIVNSTAVVAYSATLLFDHQKQKNENYILALQTLGLGFLSIGGWLGGELSYRNQVGVDPRYAEAGKWKEQTIDWKGENKILIGNSDELKTNQMKLIRIGEKRIVLAKSEDKFVAFSDHCTHKGGSLAGGAMICGTVQCPWHGSQFDVSSGEVKAGPAAEKIEVYDVAEENGNIFLLM